MVTKEEIEHTNKRILTVSGTQFDSFGYTNESNVDYMLGALSGCKTPIDQATEVVFDIVNGQPFLNGNKRTAFEVGKGIMISGAYAFTGEEQETINFIQRITNITPKKEIKNWWIKNSKKEGEITEFKEVVDENIEEDKAMLKKMD